MMVGWRALPRLLRRSMLYGERADGSRPCSFFLRHVDGGSSNVAEAEIISLIGPIYNLEGYGIRFVSSPSHADALLMTGPLTRNMLGPALAAFAVMPEPKAIVTVGDWFVRPATGEETANPCHLAATFHNSYAVVDLPRTMRRAIVAQAAGDPPEPDVLIETLLIAARRKAELRRADDDNQTSHEEGRNGDEMWTRSVDRGRELLSRKVWRALERPRRRQIGSKP